ncbi:hypothetical protein PG984_015368 [Apiospora sp. TS-2023a]
MSTSSVPSSPARSESSTSSSSDVPQSFGAPPQLPGVPPQLPGAPPQLSGTPPQSPDAPLPSIENDEVKALTYEDMPVKLPRGVPFAINGRIVNPVHTPSVDQCMKLIKSEKNTTLFHSGGMAHGGHLNKVLEQNRPYLKGYKPLCQKHTSYDFTSIYSKNKEAWSNLSHALAAGSSGTAYVLLPPGKGREGIPPNGHFAKDELPYFGPDVERVIRICPQDPNHQEEIYTRRPRPLALPSRRTPLPPRPATHRHDLRSRAIKVLEQEIAEQRAQK